MSKGLFNNQGRKSGGYKRPVIDVPLLGGKDKPILSIQCFESRHKECNGVSTLGSFPNYKCECNCHAQKILLKCSVKGCPRTRKIEWDKDFPKGTVVVTLKCPWHEDGDFDTGNLDLYIVGLWVEMWVFVFCHCFKKLSALAD